MIELAHPELFYDSTGQELARRYDVAETLACTVGANWQLQFEQVVTSNSQRTLRGLDHETCVDLGDGRTQFELQMVPGAVLSLAIPEMSVLYKTTFADLMRAAMGEDAHKMNLYNDTSSKTLRSYLSASRAALRKCVSPVAAWSRNSASANPAAP